MSFDVQTLYPREYFDVCVCGTITQFTFDTNYYACPSQVDKDLIICV